MTSADGPHYWDRLISSERDRIRRYHRPATVVFIELANLDRLGALWGEDVAAQALIRVGRTLMRQIRSSDHAARIDMGLFAVFLRDERIAGSTSWSGSAPIDVARHGRNARSGRLGQPGGRRRRRRLDAERRLDTDLGRDSLVGSAAINAATVVPRTLQRPGRLPAHAGPPATPVEVVKPRITRRGT
jgi:GGDEF domain-containing protein